MNTDKNTDGKEEKPTADLRGLEVKIRVRIDTHLGPLRCAVLLSRVSSFLEQIISAINIPAFVFLRFLRGEGFG